MKEYKFWSKAVGRFMKKAGASDSLLAEMDAVLKNNTNRDILPGKPYNQGFLLKINEQVIFCHPLSLFTEPETIVSLEADKTMLTESLASAQAEPDVIENYEKFNQILSLTERIAEIDALIATANEALIATAKEAE